MNYGRNYLIFLKHFRNIRDLELSPEGIFLQNSKVQKSSYFF